MDFKVGDRVVMVASNNNVQKGNIWTIRKVNGYLNVEWDNFLDGHSLNGLIKSNRWWDVDTYMVKLIIELTKKQRTLKIKKIIKEINSKKDFKESFEDVSKEVNSWSNMIIKEWNLK